jgi:hypothetical protein
MAKKTLDELAQEARLKEAAANEAALRVIPERYRDYLMYLPQNECILNWKPDEDKKYYPEGVFYWESKKKTYITLRYPYMVVAGRVKWFCEDHREAGAKYAITTNIKEITEMMKNGQPIPPGYPFVTKITSELHGEAEALASINIGGKSVDATFPFENAETSSLGRALAKMGYGLIGSGLASAEEVEEAMKRGSGETPKPSGETSEPTETPELVEIASDSKDVPTSKGIYTSYELADGRILMVTGDIPKLPQGAKVCVSGIIAESKTGDIVLWAKQLDSVA